MHHKLFKTLAAAFLSVFALCGSAQAHFGMAIPSAATIMDKKDANIKLDIAFSHPSAGQGMDMEKPIAFSVNVNGQSLNLLDSLKPGEFFGHKAWTAEYAVKRPGLYQFAITPAPYFEPAEDCFIIHYTKTLVAAFGAEDGWEKPLGLPMEILPLTRPFGNFKGNVFQGVVLKNGKPLPGAIVEVESLNQNPRHVGPNDYYDAQQAMTDANGVFTVGIPWAGWWGFAALAEAEEQLEFQGRKKNVELGGILWLRFAEPQIIK